MKIRVWNKRKETEKMIIEKKRKRIEMKTRANAMGTSTREEKRKRRILA